MPEIPSQYPHDASDFNKSSLETTMLSRWRLRSITREALDHTSGPLVEIGGPSEAGYLAIDKMALPNGLIIGNRVHDDGASLLFDVRDMPFGDKSLGGILMKGLTRIPEERAKTAKFPGGLSMFHPDVQKADGHIIKLLSDSGIGDYSGWNDPEIMKYSLRLALLKEARRTIEPNGVLIVNTLFGGEIRLAEQLGFALIGTTDKEKNLGILIPNHGEFVFQLSDMTTPAGVFIEELSKGQDAS
jgi:hypothetical protein